MTDLRDALVSELGKTFEASGHPYTHYTIQTAADAAMKVIEAWTADEPKPTKTKKHSA